MDFRRTMVMICLCSLFLFSSSSGSNTSRAEPLATTPTPAPAPEPTRQLVNLTDLLTFAGDYHTFLRYLISTESLGTLQDLSNNTENGITIFVPDDKAFELQRNPSLTRLRVVDLKSLILAHTLSNFYTFADFRNLSRLNPVSTIAGPNFPLNFTDYQGTIQISSRLTTINITGSVHVTPNVAVYEINKVLLPIAIFGTDLPPAPEPAPGITKPTDAPSESRNATTSSEAPADLLSPSSPSSSRGIAMKWGFYTHFVLITSGILGFFL